MVNGHVGVNWGQAEATAQKYLRPLNVANVALAFDRIKLARNTIAYFVIAFIMVQKLVSQKSVLKY